jgi:hypothetical protein
MVRNAKLHSVKEEIKTLKVAFILLRTRLEKGWVKGQPFSDHWLPLMDLKLAVL